MSERAIFLSWLKRLNLEEPNNSFVKLNSILQKICELLIESSEQRNSEFNLSGVLQWHFEVEGKITTLAIIGYLDQILPTRHETWQSISGYVLDQKAHVLVENVAASEFFSSLLAQEPIDTITRSLIAIPINIGLVREAGVLYFVSNKPFFFNQVQKNWLSSLAGILTTTILNLQKQELFNRFRYQKRINAALVQQDDFNVLLGNVLNNIRDYFFRRQIDVQRAIYLFDAVNTKLLFLSGNTANWVGEIDIRQEPDHLLCQAVRTGISLIVDDGISNTLTQFATPIRDDQKVQGVLCIETDAKRIINYNDMQFLEEVSAQIALANIIHTLRKVKQMREAAIGTVGYMDWMQHSVSHQINQSLATIDQKQDK